MEARWFLGGRFKYVLCSPLYGEDEPILTSIFFNWVGSTGVGVFGDGNRGFLLQWVG